LYDGHGALLLSYYNIGYFGRGKSRVKLFNWT
jgi:hypothetical protein